MTHEEKEVIRERNENYYIEYVGYRIDIKNLLAALDKEEKTKVGWEESALALDNELSRYHDIANTLRLDLVHARGDLGKGIDRIEALERAIRLDEPPCKSCLYTDASPGIPPCSDCIKRQGWQNWQFDEARFSKPAKNGG